MPDAVYWPVTWRESFQRIKTAGSFNIPIIGYFPGGSYSLKSTLYALKRIGFRASLPYIFESMVSYRKQINRMLKNNFCRLIAITDYTANDAISSGWSKDKINSIPPGKNSKNEKFVSPILPEKVLKWLSGRPYYLFMGPPAAIRGVYEMLYAFDTAADIRDDFCLICLFRSDAKLETQKIKNIISSLKNSHRIYSEWQSLSKEKLFSFIENCHALIQPFVLIPSEIPLAIIENMAWGKPVIVSNNEGTGVFISPFGIQCSPGNKRQLVDAMIKLIADEQFYNDKKQVVLKHYHQHPTWEEVGKEWLECGIATKNNF